MVLTSTSITTPLGSMIALADDTALYFLAFEDQADLEQEKAALIKITGATIVAGGSPITAKLSAELKDYFAGKLTTFKTPVKLVGTPFQLKVWKALQSIPFGKTVSYAQLSHGIGLPNAFRAVANANGANRLPLIIPCHRVIKSDGQLCGYNSGVSRKAWLLEHETMRP
jgi:AraC family transcriptional regulator, regulatory protein of adaptative response / methylated-DNA-[protein]-cysteine methyltransferase